eukprot:4650574-Amphidinium_carterae.6
MAGRVPTAPEFRQTVFEGELLGVVRAAQHSTGSVVIHCDNKSVVCGAQKVLTGTRSRRKEKHPELWDLLEQSVRPGLRIQKVKAHQKEPGAHEPAWYYWDGNQRADEKQAKLWNFQDRPSWPDKGLREGSRDCEKFVSFTLLSCCSKIQKWAGTFLLNQSCPLEKQQAMRPDLAAEPLEQH